MDCVATPVVDFATFRGLITDRQMLGMFRTGWQMHYPSIENFLVPLGIATGASANDGDYTNPEFDAKLDEAASAPSAEEAIGKPPGSRAHHGRRHALDPDVVRQDHRRPLVERGQCQDHPVRHHRPAQHLAGREGHGALGLLDHLVRQAEVAVTISSSAQRGLRRAPAYPGASSHG